MRTYRARPLVLHCAGKLRTRLLHNIPTLLGRIPVTQHARNAMIVLEDHLCDIIHRFPVRDLYLCHELESDN
jgi:hypothetical protein